MKISVLTPSFNSAAHINRAIQSVTRQDYKNWEHIVVDGDSIDKTIDVIREYKHLIWTSEKDRGQSDAMNKAFRRSTGDLIIYLNADDELEPSHFSRVISYFERNPGCDMVVCDLRVSKQGAVTIRTPSTSLLSILADPQQQFPANPVSYCYRRSLQVRIGDFPIDNHFTMDYWFLLRAYLFGRVFKADFVGGTFYLDGTNKSSDHKRSKQSMLAVRKDFVKRYFFYPEVFRYVLLRALKRFTKK